jgi:hypothetical protein
MIAVPAATEVMAPVVALIVATAVFDDTYVQFGVPVVPSLMCTTQLPCDDEPATTGVGVTEAVTLLTVTVVVVVVDPLPPQPAKLKVKATMSATALRATIVRDLNACVLMGPSFSVGFNLN